MNIQLPDYILTRLGIDNPSEIEKKLVELYTIFEMNQRFLEAGNSDEIANLLLLIPMGRFLITRAALILKMGNQVQCWTKGKWTLPEGYRNICLHFHPEQILAVETQQDRIPPAMLHLLHENKIEWIIPVQNQQQRVGFVLLGRKLSGQSLIRPEVESIQSILNLNIPFLINSRILLSLEESNKQLDNHIQTLETIMETTRRLDALFEREKVISLFLLTLMGRLTVSRYLWVQLDEATGKFSIVQEKGIHLSPQDMENLIRLIRVGKKETPFINTSVIPSVPTLPDQGVVVPYQKENELKSVLILGPKLNRKQWEQMELEFLSILFSQVQSILENLVLLEQKIETEILEKELEVAQTIQRRLLPTSPPDFPGWEVTFFNHSSRQVGGDYCDLIPVGDWLYIVIADVSGKSIPAALLMSNVQSAIRLLVDFHLELPELVFRLNNQLARSTASDRFVTLFIGKIHLRDGKLFYIDAGHNPPLLWHQECQLMDELSTGGILLGMMENVAYQQGENHLQYGDILICYTDGVTETLNASGEEFGEERLKQFILNNHHLSARQLLNGLIEELKNFSGKPIASDDDITFIIIKRRK